MYIRFLLEIPLRGFPFQINSLKIQNTFQSVPAPSSSHVLISTIMIIIIIMIMIIILTITIISILMLILILSILSIQLTKTILVILYIITPTIIVVAPRASSSLRRATLRYVCLLLGIPLRGFPFQMKLPEDTEHLKRTHMLLFKAFHLKRKSPQRDLKQETYRKHPVLFARARGVPFRGFAGRGPRGRRSRPIN